MCCGGLPDATIPDVCNSRSISKGSRRTPEEGIAGGASRPQPPPATDIIRPPAGQAIPRRISAMGFEGWLCAGVALQGGSINGGHRPDIAAGDDRNIVGGRY